MMVFGGSTATAAAAPAHDGDLGRPPTRRMSSSAEGRLGDGRGRGGGQVPETAVLVLGNFQGAVVLDLGLVTVRVRCRLYSK